MDLTSIKTIKALFAERGTHPSKRLGQNFLIDRRILRKIIAMAEIDSGDVILEIGPGAGTLTKELAATAKKVIAVEKDRQMAEVLKETLKGYKNVDVIVGDILKEKPPLPKRYKIAANIPYYLTSALIRMFLEAKNPPESMVLMVQKEVAQRICGKPPKMSLLAASVQFYAEPKIIFHVSKNCFWPAPKVDSAVIKITPRINTDEERTNADLFFKIAKTGFAHPRKQLANNLSKGLKKDKKAVELWLAENKISPAQRAETLSVSDWKRLAKSIQHLR